MNDVPTLPDEVKRRIEEAVAFYDAERGGFETQAGILQDQLLSNLELRKLIHSAKRRTKEPSHLRDKLYRKATEAAVKHVRFDISKDNLFEKVHDLAGVRLLHLHTGQIVRIHPLIMHVFEEEKYVLLGKPDAKTWDIENESMFKSLGVKPTTSPSFYTSVHYSVKANRVSPRTCELQVRTLAEEIWGEISHTIHYPHETQSIACKEQLKVLARVVASCSRLVTSIVASADEHQALLGHAVVVTPAPARKSRRTSAGKKGGRIAQGKRASRVKGTRRGHRR